MPEDKKDDDIVGRLEALRSKIPAEKKGTPATAAPAPAASAPPETTEEEPVKRKKLARIIGIVVILVIVGVVATVGLKMFAPGKEEGAKVVESQKVDAEALKAAAEAQKLAAEIAVNESRLAAEKVAELQSAKTIKTGEVREAFKGTSPDLGPEKQKVLDQIESATTIQEVNAVDANSSLDEAWETVTNALKSEAISEAETKATEFEAIGMKAGTVSYSGLEYIKRQIGQLSYNDIKNLYFFEIGIEYVPIRLSREQFTGGFVEVGDSINIHYVITDDEGQVNESTRSEYLAKGGKVMAIMRAQSSATIALSESEIKTDTGGGSEGKGTVTSLAIGSLGTVSPADTYFDASVGYKMRQTSSTYTVDITEIQKAAAASKVPESYITMSLENYGVKLNTYERETNIGDFDTEYLMLVEMDEIEASKVVSKLINDEERDRLLATISKPKPESWMEKIG